MTMERFLAADGDPVDSAQYLEKRKELSKSWVAAHSGGIPVRAMLDQLTQISAVEILPEQRVKAKSEFLSLKE